MFSGIAGLDLGLKLAMPGSRTVLYLEREAFCVEILVQAMRNGFLDEAPVWSDAATIDYGPWRGLVDGIIAGFPCPPVSVAGKRKGVKDHRWLWPEVWRAVRETGAGWLFFENVPGLLSANDGAAFNAVLGNLAEGGFAAEWLCLSAAQCGAPQKRERIFLLAHHPGHGRGPRRAEPEGFERQAGSGNGREPMEHAINGRQAVQATRQEPRREGGSGSEPMGDAGQLPGRLSVQERGPDRRETPGRPSPIPYWPPGPGDRAAWDAILRDFPDLAPATTKSAFCGNIAGVAAGMGGWSNRLHQLRALGNSVVPIVAAAAFLILHKRLTNRPG